MRGKMEARIVRNDHLIEGVAGITIIINRERTSFHTTADSLFSEIVILLNQGYDVRFKCPGGRDLPEHE